MNKKADIMAIKMFLKASNSNQSKTLIEKAYRRIKQMIFEQIKISLIRLICRERRLLMR